jgi:hypothetical protein
MLDMILLKRFEKRPGHQKIHKGESALKKEPVKEMSVERMSSRCAFDRARRLI